MRMKSITKKLVFSLIFVISVFISNTSLASTIMAKITGTNIQWSNVRLTKEGSVTEINWNSAEKFHMLPVSEFLPGFVNNGMKEITLKNISTDNELSVDFELESVNFKSIYSGGIDIEPSGLGSSCVIDTINGLEASVGGTNTVCTSQRKMVFEKSVEPFKFYNVSFSLPNLIERFKELDMPSGKYVGHFNYDLAYGSKLKNDIITYNTYPAEPITIIIDYKKSFMSSLNVIGDGEFDLTYDKNKHTVSGKTNYFLSVNGSLEPGIKMTFKSAGDVDDFKLMNRESGASIPYSIECIKCRDSLVVDSGTLVASDRYSYIDFVGSMLNFNLKFYFDEMKLNDISISEPGDIEPGQYYDNVVVMFELNL